MSSTTHSITLTAKDGTKQAFDAIKRGAEQDVAALKNLGQQGSAALKQVDAAAKSTERSTESMSTRMAALGGAAATAAGVLSDWSRSSQDAAAIQRQLEASITATGESFSTYEARVKAAGEAALRLGQDDEAASQAISALTQITGDANVALDQMGLVMDLAAAKNMSLEAAATLVGKVLEGNIGILNRQGFAISENATATEALAQVQTAVAGQAEASATTYAVLRERFANLTDSIGGTVGEFAPMLAMLPGVSVGFSAVGSAVGALAPNLTAAGVASKALSVAMGPVGLVLAAAAAGVAIYEFAQKADAANLSASEAAEGITSFTNAIAEIGAGDAAASLISYVDLLAKIATQTQENKALSEEAALAVSNAREAETNALMGGTQAQREAATAALAAAVAFEEQLQANIVSQDEFNKLQEALLNIATDPNPLNADLVAKELERLKAAYESGGLSADEYVAAVTNLDKTHKSFGLTLDELAGKTKTASSEMSASAKLIESAIGDLFAVKLSPDLLEDIETIKTLGSTDAKMALESFFTQYKEGGVTLDQFGVKVDGIADKVETLTGTTKRLTAEDIAAADAQNRWRPQIEATSQAMDLQKQRLDAAAQAAKGYAESLVGASSFASKIRPVDISVSGGDKVTGQAANLQQTASVLNSVLGTFQQLDSIGQASQRAESIADTMIGDPDKLGIIDRLVDQNRISVEEYQAAVKAGNAIQKEAGAIENDLNTIRARQLPLLAEAQTQYGNTIDSISKMGAEQQMAAIGFMDTNEAMKAQNAVALATAAAQSEVGSTARAAATEIIAGAVAADPVLESMLTKIGLVARDREGNLVINFDNADELNSSTDALTIAITNLERAIRGLPPIDIIETGGRETEATALAVTAAVSGIPGFWNTTISEEGGDGTATTANIVAGALYGIPTNVNTNITAIDNASGVAQYVANVMAGLNGTSVTTTLYMNYVKTGDGTGMAGGGMVGAAQGRLTTDAQRIRVNEGGQEMVTLPTGDDVWLPTGSMVTPSAASKYGRQGGKAGGAVNFYAPVYIQANNPQQLYDALRSGRIAEARA